jgi:hypothetical protein
MLEALNVLLALACLAVGTYLLVDYLRGGGGGSGSSQGAPRGSEAPTTTPAPAATKDAKGDKAGLPEWAIALIAIVGLILVLAGCYAGYRRGERVRRLKEFVRQGIEEGRISEEFTGHKERWIGLVELLSRQGCHLLPSTSAIIMIPGPLMILR